MSYFSVLLLILISLSFASGWMFYVRLTSARMAILLENPPYRYFLLLILAGSLYGLTGVIIFSETEFKQVTAWISFVYHLRIVALVLTLAFSFSPILDRLDGGSGIINLLRNIIWPLTFGLILLALISPGEYLFFADDIKKLSTPFNISPGIFIYKPGLLTNIVYILWIFFAWLGLIFLFLNWNSRQSLKESGIINNRQAALIGLCWSLALATDLLVFNDILNFPPLFDFGVITLLPLVIRLIQMPDAWLHSGGNSPGHSNRSSRLSAGFPAEKEAIQEKMLESIVLDLKTTLELISAPIETAVRSHELPDKQSFRTMFLNTRRVTRMLEQVGELQRLNRDKTRLNLTGINLEKFLNLIYQNFEPYARVKDIKVKTRVEENLAMAYADPELICQCVYSFLSNSLRFTEKGGEISIHICEWDNELKLEILDPGLETAARRGIDVFSDGDEALLAPGALEAKTGGPGEDSQETNIMHRLSLLLIREVLRLHGGRSGASADPKKGARFWLTLPRAGKGVREAFLSSLFDGEKARNEFGILQGNYTEKLSGTTNPASSERGAEHSILIADDNRGNRFYMVQLLVKIGYDVVAVPSGEELLTRLSVFRPDLVIVDRELPGISGVEVISRLRSSDEYGTLPTILLISGSDPEINKQGREAGANTLLSKPFNELELIAIVRNLISLKGKEKQYVREMEQARRIQTNLLPRETPSNEHFTIEARFEPMELVGGDLYDFIRLADGRMGVFVADVSGHGISAAMIASMVKLIISIFAEDLSSPGELLEYINGFLFGKTAGNFLTSTYGILEKDGKTITMANAGHPSVLHLRDGKVNYYEQRGKAVGWLKSVQYKDFQIKLEEGDRLFFYTDGIVEAFDADKVLFGEESLTRLISQTSMVDLNEQLNLILLSVTEYQVGNYIQDDVTLVGLEVGPGGTGEFLDK